MVAYSPGSIFIGNVPLQLEADQVKELVKTFGEIQDFQILQGRALFVYTGGDAAAKVAIAGLNGLSVLGQALTAKRAVLADASELHGLQGSATPLAITDAPIAADLVPAVAPTPAKVVVTLELAGIAGLEQLQDAEELEAIELDVQQECSELGEVTEVRLPRVDQEGAGSVFVDFSVAGDAERARRALDQRKYADRIVSARILGELSNGAEVARMVADEVERAAKEDAARAAKDEAARAAKEEAERVQRAKAEAERVAKAEAEKEEQEYQQRVAEQVEAMDDEKRERDEEMLIEERRRRRAEMLAKIKQQQQQQQPTPKEVALLAANGGAVDAKDATSSQSLKRGGDELEAESADKVARTE